MTLKEYIKLATHQIHEGAQPFCSISFPISVHFDIGIELKGEEIIVTNNPNATKISFDIDVYLK